MLNGWKTIWTDFEKLYALFLFCTLNLIPSSTSNITQNTMLEREISRVLLLQEMQLILSPIVSSSFVILMCCSDTVIKSLITQRWHNG
jgi:hypothetical protein